MESAVYLLALSDPAGPFKIGLADRADQRAGAVIGAPLDQLAGESSVAYFPTRSIAARVERLMHAVFEPQRLRTGPYDRTGASEWFARQAFDPARDLLTSQVSLLGGRLVPFRDVLPPRLPPRPKPVKCRGRILGAQTFKKNPAAFWTPPWFYVPLLQRTVWELREHLVYFESVGTTVAILFLVDGHHPAVARLLAFNPPNFCAAAHTAGREVVYFTAAGVAGTCPRAAYRWQRFASRLFQGYQRWRPEWAAPLGQFLRAHRATADFDPFYHPRHLRDITPHWL